MGDHSQHRIFLCLGLLSCVVALQTELPDVHLKPFGYGKRTEVEEVQGNIPTKRFFEEYVLPSKPVVMRGATKIWPAFQRWETDDYFFSVAPNETYTVTMDVKLGDPATASKFVDWKEFLRIYNTSKRRMVENTPAFLLQDVTLPGPLQCDILTKNEFLMGHKMWFGNNYTASQVHKDAADNINCLVKGIKEYTIVDPKYQKYVVFDRPNGLYSNMDVDKVDYNRYPGLDKVEYLVSTLQPGDCMFVPYKWIHQVRSWGRNIAINVWWNYWKNKEVNVDSCPTTTDPEWTVDKATYVGWADFESRDIGVKEHLTDLITLVGKPVMWPKYAVLFTSYASIDGEVSALHSMNKDIRDTLKQGFNAMDTDGDRKITPSDLEAMNETQWKVAIESMRNVLQKTREQSEEGSAAPGSGYANQPPPSTTQPSAEVKKPLVGVIGPEMDGADDWKDEL